VVLENLGTQPATGLRSRWTTRTGDFSAHIAEQSIAVGCRALLELEYRPTGGDSDRALLQLTWDQGGLALEVWGYQDLTAPR
jgi:hypothetical protein